MIKKVPSLHWFKVSRKVSQTDRGQVAIFAVILFHLFFIFFAMVINVGLLVFHKINLQNSVDFAAYYGAMKQAEVLNAIAHINYQMRQAWKLLTFRYRAYGMAGNSDSNRNPPVRNIPFYCQNAYPNTCGIPVGQPPLRANDTDDFAHFNPSCLIGFCANYRAWVHMNQATMLDGNYCRMDCISGTNITLAGIPNATSFGGALVALGLPGVAARAILFSQQAVSNQIEECRRSSLISWITLSAIIYAYRWDMLHRKALLMALAQGLSQDTNDFQDLDGESAREGTIETFRRNLTLPNRESFDQDPNGQFFFYNSLGHEACRWSGNKDESPRWIQPILVRPMYRFVDPNCAEGIETISRNYYPYDAVFTGVPPTPNSAIYRASPIFPTLQNWVLEPPADSYNNPRAQFLASTVGFEKNPWCVAYVGVEAKTTPKIPFSPLGSVTLAARAIAKPFGGRVGPWYTKVWPRSSPISGNISIPISQKTERFLSFRADNSIQDYIENFRARLSSFGNTSAEALPQDLLDAFELSIPNFNHFVGDTGGSSSLAVMRNWLHAVYRASNAIDGHKLSAQEFVNIILGGTNDNADPLPWPEGSPDLPPQAQGGNYRIRLLELEAILPNQFDLAYYSIDFNFFDNYARRMHRNQRLLQQMANIIGGATATSQSAPFMIRGDLGYRPTANAPYDRFSIKHQYLATQSLKGPPPHINRSAQPLIVQNFLTPQLSLQIPPALYYGRFDERTTPTLTFWHMEKPGDYRFKEDFFGQCSTRVDENKIVQNPLIEATPNDCIIGGRSGYSVKLVDPYFLIDPQPLGGPGTNGPPLNPPPDRLLRN